MHPPNNLTITLPEVAKLRLESRYLGGDIWRENGRIYTAMLMQHVASLTVSLLYYLMLGVCLYGWGWVMAGLLRRLHPSYGRLSEPLLVWLGFATLLLILQVIHLFLPLRAWSFIPVLGVGLFLGAVRLSGQAGKAARAGWVPWDRKMAYGVLMLALVATWIASRSMLTPTNYDTGLYYMNTIRWINSYPIVPGLGNLHGRLAFNQSFFPYVAALNLHPFFGHGRSIANSFLFMLSIGTVLHMLRPVLAKPGRLLELPAIRWLPALFVLPILGFIGLYTKDLASPSPDLAVTLHLILMFLLFFHALDGYLRTGRIPLALAVMLTILAATTVTIKLSSLVPAALLAGLTAAAALRKSDRPVGDAALLLVPPAVILLVWMGRGIITSGVPLFPSTFGYIQTDWSVPPAAIREEADIVYGWARKPWVHYSEVLGDWGWLPEWFARLRHFPTLVLYPSIVFILLMLAALVLRRTAGRKVPPVPVVWWLPGAVVLAGLVFWFFTAPDPRFARAMFVLLPVSAAVPVGLLLRQQFTGRKFLLLLGILFAVVNSNYLVWTFQNWDQFLVVSYEGWHPVKTVPVIIKHTRSGLPVYVNAAADKSMTWDIACWDAPLPCAPLFNEHLKLRHPPDLGRGFTIEEGQVPLPGPHPQDP